MKKLEQALAQLESIIRMLDEADAPPEIAAHLDLGRTMLEALLGSPRSS